MARLLLFVVVSTAAVAAIALGIALFGQLIWRAEKESTRNEVDYFRGLVDEINNLSGGSWKARLNPLFLTKEDTDAFFATHKGNRPADLIREYVEHLKEFFASETMQKHLSELENFPDSELPAQFDAREKWPECSKSIGYVRNQGACGSCFANGAVGVASDRTCIASLKTGKSTASVSSLSVQDVIGCCSACGSCYGGEELLALIYWVKQGIVSGDSNVNGCGPLSSVKNVGCRPYEFDSDCGGTPCKPDSYPPSQEMLQCRQQCQKSNEDYLSEKHFGSIAYAIYPTTLGLDADRNETIAVPSIIGHFNESTISRTGQSMPREQIRNVIKKELYLHGPTTMSFPVLEEFLHYWRGVYKPYPSKEKMADRKLYGHVVKLIGWGEYVDEEGQQQNYWLLVNSWGKQWGGEEGLFRMDTTAFEESDLYPFDFNAGLL